MTDRNDEDPLSRASVARAAQSLRARPGWDPKRPAEGGADARIEEALAEMRATGVAERAYAGETDCPDCESTRIETEDPTGLCPRHFDDAMGL